MFIATLVSSLLTVFVTTLIGTCPATGLIIATIIGSKNIFKIIINRVLNFKKETKTKNGDTKVNYFFDMLTMIGILSSVASIVVKIPGFKEWFDKILGKIFDFGITKSSAAESSFKFDKSVLKVDGTDGDIEDLGSFESVKKLLDEAENMKDPVYGTSNSQISSFFQTTLEAEQMESSKSYITALTTLTQSSDKSDLYYAAKNEISDDGIVTSVMHMFKTSSSNTSLIGGNLTKENTLKDLLLRFTQLHDEDSNIGFYISSRLIDTVTTDGERKFKVVKGVLDASGKILEIEGANADSLVGKQWDDLAKLLVN